MLHQATSTRRLKKSRTGCTSCRTRKVKCDEQRPVCGNCSRRYVDDTKPCEYAAVPARRQRGRQQDQDSDRDRIGIPQTHIAGLASKSGGIVRSNPEAAIHRSPTLQARSLLGHNSNSRWHALELRLMYHYASVVSRTLPDCNGKPAVDMWQRIIPQLAFDSEIVLNPMLALSALHLHAHSPGDTPMSVAISRYLDRSLVKHREALQNYDGELTEPVWLSAVIMAVLYWVLTHHSRPGVTYELPLEAWNMLYGVSTLFVRRYTLLEKMGYAWYGHRASPVLVMNDELGHEARTQLQDLQADINSLLQQFDIQSRGQEEQAAYQEAQREILTLYRAFFSGTATRNMRLVICTMPIRCTPVFRQLLQDHDPLAMALTARLLVLLVPLEPVWWMDGMGEYEVLERDITGICDLLSPELRWCMKWPLDVLRGEYVLTR